MTRSISGIRPRRGPCHRHRLAQTGTARTRIENTHGNGGQGRIDGEDAHGAYDQAPWREWRAASNLLDRFNLRHEMAEQILDAALQVAVDEGHPEHAPFMCEIHDAVLKAAKNDVAAIARNGRANPRFKQILDRRDDCASSASEKFLRRRSFAGVGERTGAPDM